MRNLRILGDQAILSIDDDKLERTKYAESIANGILNWSSKESLCMALHGPWGSGKTSIINLCLQIINDRAQYLEESKRPIIVKFQPWLISGQEKLIKAFLLRLKNVLNQNSTSDSIKSAVQQLDKYEKILGLAALIPTVGEYAKQLNDILGHSKDVLSTIAKYSEEDLEKTKEAICNALLGAEAPILIVIDDIDRLTSEEIKQLFQVVKSVADFPNTIYLLAFDHTLIQEALSDLQQGSETSYLEKIIQLEFDVPNPPRTRLVSVLWQEIQFVTDDISSSQSEMQRWNELKFGYLPYLFRNVREIKRYINALSFKYQMMKGEINPIDLIIIEAIRLMAFPVYEQIRKNRAFLISDNPYKGLRTNEKDEAKKILDIIWAEAPNYCLTQIKGLLTLLFPEVYQICKNVTLGGYRHNDWEKDTRMCISTFFDYYFQTVYSEGEVSEQEVNTAIGELNNPESLFRLFKIYIAEGNFTKLLHRMENKLEDDSEEEKLVSLFTSVSLALEGVSPEPRKMDEFPVSWQIKGVFYRLLKKIEPDKRKVILSKMIEQTETHIGLAVCFVELLRREWNPIHDEREKPDEEKLLKKEEIQELVDISLTLIRRARETDSFLKVYALSSVLLAWSNWAKDEPKEWAIKLLQNDENVPAFLTAFINYQHCQKAESYYTTAISISPKEIEFYYDSSQLKETCERLLEEKPSWLNSGDLELVELFVTNFDKKDIFK